MESGSLDFHVLTNQQLKWLLNSPRNHGNQIGTSITEPPRDGNTYPLAQQTSFWQTIDDDPTDGTPAEITEESEVEKIKRLAKIVSDEIEAVKSDTQLDESTKSERLNVLNKADDWFQKAQTYKRKHDLYHSEVEKFSETLTEKQEELKQAEAAEPDTSLDPNMTPEQLQNNIQKVQSELDNQKTDLESLNSSVDQFAQRSAKIPGDKSDAQKRLNKDQDVDANARDATNLLQLGIRLASLAETKMLNVETRYLEMQSQLSPLKIDIANIKLKHKVVRLDVLKRAADKARNDEIAEQQRLARKATQDAALNAHPALLAFAKRNQTLTEERQKLAVSIKSMLDEAADVGGQTKSVAAELDSLKKQVKQNLAKENSLMIAEKRRQMISPLESRVRLGQIQKEIHRVNLLEFQLQEERDSLSDPETVIAETLNIDMSNAVANVKEMASELIQTRRKLLGDALTDYRSYKSDLVKAEAARKELLSGLSETQKLLNEHMMWVRSTDPVSLQTVKSSAKGIRSLLSTDKWHVLVDRLFERAQARPYEYFMFAIGFVFLAGVVKRLRV